MSMVLLCYGVWYNAFILGIGVSLVICHSDQIGSNWRLQSPDRRPDQKRKGQKGAEGKGEKKK